MRKGDISNLPAMSVCCNVAAICNVPPEPSVFDRLMNKGADPIPMHSHAEHIIPRILLEGYNLLLLVENARLFNFAENMVKHHKLPFTMIFHCPSSDHYRVIRHSYRMTAGLWVGKKDSCQWSDPDILEYTDTHGWFALFTHLTGGKQ